MAATITSARAEFGRLKTGIPNEYGTLQFNTPTGIQAGASDDIILTFSADFTLAAEDATNFDIELGDAACATAGFTDQVVETAAADADNWSIDVTGNVITIEPETDVGLTAGRCFRLVWGTATSLGGAGAADTITNGAEDDDDTIVISGGFGDSGTITVDIIDDDQVSITATVNQSITFDLDTATTDTNSDDPYSVALGTLTVGAVNRSDGTINSIWMDINTNASGGAAITVTSANGALESTAVPADTIPSATATMAAGTANYGLCVAASTAASGSLDEVAPFDGATCVDGAVNTVGGVTTSPQSILDTNDAPIATGRAQVRVNAAISGVTKAHADYTDTLTFIATGTF